MKVKKYKARTMSEAMQLIKKELGPDAVILQSKELKKGGIFGLFKHKYFEVIAALDQEPILQAAVTQHTSKQVLPTIHTPPQDQRILGEIKQLQQLLEKQAFTSARQFPPLYESAFQYLLDQEVEMQLAEEIVQTMVQNTATDKELTKAITAQQLETVLQEKLSEISFEKPTFRKKIIQFVGPTGVGKTTTLAKVAAQTMLQHQKKIAFITMDTYRIAAIEQLKTYARILDVPIEVAYSVADYQQAIRKFNDYDYIFVDTAGRNFRDPQYVHELKKMIEIEQVQVETYLVLALTAKALDLMDTYNQFKDIVIEKVIFTKVDETLSYGSILNICLGEQKSILYMTNGQNVPDDVLEPTPALIITLLLSRYYDE